MPGCSFLLVSAMRLLLGNGSAYCPGCCSLGIAVLMLIHDGPVFCLWPPFPPPHTVITSVALLRHCSCLQVSLVHIFLSVGVFSFFLVWIATCTAAPLASCGENCSSRWALYHVSVDALYRSAPIGISYRSFRSSWSSADVVVPVYLFLFRRYFRAICLTAWYDSPTIQYLG